MRRPLELGQYTSVDYTQTLDDHGVLASVGSVGDADERARRGGGTRGKIGRVVLAASTVAIVAIAAAIIVVALLASYILPGGGRRKRRPRT